MAVDKKALRVWTKIVDYIQIDLVYIVDICLASLNWDDLVKTNLTQIYVALADLSQPDLKWSRVILKWASLI